MADRARPLTAGDWTGVGAAASVAALILGSFLAVLSRAGGGGTLTAADWPVIRFSLIQPLVSAVLSAVLAVPVARALARRQFAGRRALITLLGAPFVLPVVVAVLGLLAVFGRGGIINTALTAMGLPLFSIYGFHGVVLANVFFNLPLATRLLLQGWLAIPMERFRLAAALNFGPGDMFRRLELPMLAEVVPGVVLSVFLICLTSFTVALTLGGGPGATTLELAIYQAFRFDFDLGRAAVLSLVQFGLCVAVAAVSLGRPLPAALGAGLDRQVQRADANGTLPRMLDAGVLAAAAVFLILPPGVLAARGLPMVGGLPAQVWVAAGRSFIMAGVSGVLSLSLGLALALASQRIPLLEAVGMLTLAISPMVIGTGLFILTAGWADPVSLALPVTVLVNAVMALPFVLRSLMPPLRALLADYGQLADSLNLRGTARLRLLILPRLRRPLGFAGGLAAAMAMGDLGVVTLFADAGRATLPMEIFALMGAYEMDAAAGAGFVLLCLSLLIFWLFDRAGRLDAAV